MYPHSSDVPTLSVDIALLAFHVNFQSFGLLGAFKPRWVYYKRREEKICIYLESCLFIELTFLFGMCDASRSAC